MKKEENILSNGWIHLAMMNKYFSLNEKGGKRISLFIVLSVSFLVVFGCVMVYSASSYTALNNYNNEYYFLTKQIIGVALGFVAMYVTYKIDYHKYIKFKYLILAVSFLALILVFIPGLSYENYGAKRWISLPGFTVQGSEIAKFGFVIFSAIVLSKQNFNSKKLISYLPVLIVGVAMCGLIILEPNMSITMCLGAVMLLMVFVSGMKWKHLMLLLLPALALVPLLIIVEPYRLKRLFAFINPWVSPQAEGFQLIQSLYSLGSGGLFGVGLFNSRQKYQFLPFSESDFIFSIIGEEFGFVGAIILVAIFVFLTIMIIGVAKRAVDRYGALLAFGIASVICVQTLINVAVVTGSIPPTGVPLPFISAGSSSLIVCMAVIGIVLNINKQSNNELRHYK